MKGRDCMSAVWLVLLCALEGGSLETEDAGTFVGKKCSWVPLRVCD